MRKIIWPVLVATTSLGLGFVVGKKLDHVALQVVDQNPVIPQPPVFDAENFRIQAFKKYSRFETKGLIGKITELSDKKTALHLAPLIKKMAMKHQLSEDLIVAIIATESSFNSKAVSSTGDIGLAQINPKVWAKEFKRRKMPFYAHRLKDPAYNLEVMGLILDIIRGKTSHDPIWYGRYHSATGRFKEVYVKKVYESFNQVIATN